MTVQVIVVDDDPLARTALSTILAADLGIEVVGEASNGAEAVEMARRLRPDVVVMDIRMPVLNGIDATRHLTSLRPPPGRVLILTTFGDEEYVFASLRAGASGFLLKNAPAEELTAGVRTVAAGDALLAPAVTRLVVERYLASAGQTQSSKWTLDRLTPREMEVMTWMARGLSNGQIADKLVLAETTVKTHVARILTKLAVRDRAQVVIAAYESGLVVAGDSDHL